MSVLDFLVNKKQNHAFHLLIIGNVDFFTFVVVFFFIL